LILYGMVSSYAENDELLVPIVGVVRVTLSIKKSDKREQL